MAQVFISKSDNASGSLAAQIAGNLECNGISCWYSPRNVSPGRGFDEDIVPAIRQCRVFLLLLTNEAQKSEHVARELNIVFKLNNELSKKSRYEDRKAVIIYQLAPLTLNDRFEYLLTGFNPILAYQPGGERQLYTAVCSALNRQPGPKAPAEFEPPITPVQKPQSAAQLNGTAFLKKLGMAVLWLLLVSMVYALIERFFFPLLTKTVIEHTVFKLLHLILSVVLGHLIWKRVKALRKK